MRLRVLGLSLLAAALPAASMAQHVDLDVKLGPNSRLTFVGGGPVPVPVVLGRRSGNTCVPIGASDDYRIRVRAFPDLQDPEPGGGLSDDRAPFRICNAGADPNSASYCANSATPVAEATLRQEDGVARLAVTNFDLPEGFCTTAPGQGTDQFFFEFTEVCDTAVTPVGTTGHVVGSPPVNGVCQGALEDHGYGRFGENVFAEPRNCDSNVANQPLFPANDSFDPTLPGFARKSKFKGTSATNWETRRNGLRLKLPLRGVQRKFSGSSAFTAAVDIELELTTGLVGGCNVGKLVPRTIALGSGTGDVPAGGAVLDRTSGAVTLTAATGTKPNEPNTPQSEYNVWGDMVAFAALPATVCAAGAAPCAPPLGGLGGLLATVFPDFDGDGVTNAIDDDDDSDGMLDDGLIGGAGSTAVATDFCAAPAPPSDAGECLLGNFEASFLPLASGGCDASLARVTDARDADGDDDGLPDGSHDKWTPGTFPAPNGEDRDFDGCLDPTETDPTDFDSDNDRLGDGRESSVTLADLALLLRNGTRSAQGYVALDLASWVLDADEATSTDPRDADSDDDGLADGYHAGWPTTDPSRPCATSLARVGEDVNLNGALDGAPADPVESDPANPDSDFDGLRDGREAGVGQDDLDIALPGAANTPADPGLTAARPFAPDVAVPALVIDADGAVALCTSPIDPDTDDDGLADGTHDLWTPVAAPPCRDGEDPDLNGRIDAGETDPRDFDSDNDRLGDGREAGVAADDLDDSLRGSSRNLLFKRTLDVALVTDADPSTCTLPHDADSDDDGLPDGYHSAWTPGNLSACFVYGEDLDLDGAVDPLSEPNQPETNPNDTDSDNDFVLDGTEVGVDADDIAVPLPADAGVPGLEVPRDWSGDVNPLNVIFDADLGASCTFPLDADSDDDGLPDGSHDLWPSAGDGTPTLPERRGEDLNRNGNVDLAADPKASETDPRNPDSDYDGLRDGLEAAISAADLDLPLRGGPSLALLGANGGTNPAGFALDGDPTTSTSPSDADTDEDGLPDGVQPAWATVPRPAGAPNRDGEDLDLDGAIDAGVETDPNRFDSDRDALGDGLESGLAASALDLTLPGGPPLAFYVASIPTASDSDPITTTEPLDADSDEDGLPDGTHDVWLLAGAPSPAGEDLDADGAVDEGVETDPNRYDSDYDQLSDGLEAGVGPDELDDPLRGGESLVAGGAERGTASPFTYDLDTATRTDPRDADGDDDGLPDGTHDQYPSRPLGAPVYPERAGEDTNANGRVDLVSGDPVASETDPNVADSDTDLLLDGLEAGLIDTDLALALNGGPSLATTGASGGTDPALVRFDLDPATTTWPTDPDTDDDALIDGPVLNAQDCPGEDTTRDGDQSLVETDPEDADSDDDNLSDGVECVEGTNALLADTDGDGINDDVELLAGTDPVLADSDGDGYCDGATDVTPEPPLPPCLANDNCPSEPNATQDDTDADTVGDACDNCVYEPNANQANAGGNFSGTADAFGDACQCADVSSAVPTVGDGVVNELDIATLRLFLSGDLDPGDPTPDDPAVLAAIAARCPIHGPTGSCTILDVALLRRAHAGETATLVAACRAASCLADATDLDGDCLLAAADLCVGFPNAADALDSSVPPDGVPDVCQCADTDADGLISSADVTRVGSCSQGLSVCDASLTDLDRDGDVDADDRLLLAAATEDGGDVASLVCLRRSGAP